jgi:multidrug transporter EmrE-like cation transporter
MRLFIYRHLEAILAVIFGAIIFQEGYSLLKLVGIELIITGVVVFLHSGNT